MVNNAFAPWGRALRGVPRLSREEWNGLDVIAKWLIATRSAVLIMTFILIIAGFFSPVMLIVLLALRAFLITLKMFREPKPDERPEWFPADAWPTRLAAFAFYHSRTFGLLFLLGLILDTVLRLIA
jgi:hypothetical protein